MTKKKRKKRRTRKKTVQLQAVRILFGFAKENSLNLNRYM